MKPGTSQRVATLWPHVADKHQQRARKAEKREHARQARRDGKRAAREEGRE